MLKVVLENKDQNTLKMAEMSQNVKRKLIEVEEIPDMKRLKISTIDDKTIQNTSCLKCKGLLWIPQSKGPPDVLVSVEILR